MNKREKETRNKRNTRKAKQKNKEQISPPKSRQEPVGEGPLHKCHTVHKVVESAGEGPESYQRKEGSIVQDNNTVAGTNMDCIPSC